MKRSAFLFIGVWLHLVAAAQGLELTPDTACGAPGIGLVRSFASGAETWRAEQRLVGTPGERVGRDGRWHTGCKMPPACAARRTLPWADQINGGSCFPATKEIRAAAEVGKMAQVNGFRDGVFVGRAVYFCMEDGTWKLDPTQTYCKGR